MKLGELLRELPGLHTGADATGVVLNLVPSPPWGRGWLATGAFTSRGETGEGVKALNAKAMTDTTQLPRPHRGSVRPPHPHDPQNVGPPPPCGPPSPPRRSEEHTSELQSRPQIVCRLLLE